jgi:hypothetical protein
MASVVISIDCELVVMGPPQPARLVLVIAHPPTGRGTANSEWLESLFVKIHIASDHVSEFFRFGAVQGGLVLFLDGLKHMQSAGEGNATLEDEDGVSYLRIGAAAGAGGSFRISGRFYSVLIDTEDIGFDPEEAGFFKRRWALASGFQGLRVYGPQLARAIDDLEAGLATLSS